MKHLWEVEHPYYCSEENYFAVGHKTHNLHDRWCDFEAEYADSDMDLNLFFRWDWQEGEDYNLPNYGGDPAAITARLVLFWIAQRKGAFFAETINVCRNDEPQILEFLRPRWEHMRQLWDPLS